jgi:hypothetical protein
LNLGVASQIFNRYVGYLYVKHNPKIWDDVDGCADESSWLKRMTSNGYKNQNCPSSCRIS